MHYSSNKDINQFIKRLIKQSDIGFKYGKKHNFLIIQNIKIAIPSTPSHISTVIKFKSQISRIRNLKI